MKDNWPLLKSDNSAYEAVQPVEFFFLQLPQIDTAVFNVQLQTTGISLHCHCQCPA